MVAPSPDKGALLTCHPVTSADWFGLNLEEAACHSQALQEDLKRRAAAVAASTGPAAAARVLHAAGPAEARRELEGIRAQALADQRSKLESKRKLDQPAARQEGPPATAVVAVEVPGLGQAAGRHAEA